MSNQTNIITGADGVTEAEFIVHTKHTCDTCYTRPIVGKRFTSGLVKDFDLCAKCFEGYDEEKKGEFSETVLGRDRATKNSFVLKLKIDNVGDNGNGSDVVQTRRINVVDLWDPSLSQLSFKKMMSIAHKFVLTEMDDETDGVRLFDSNKAKATYIDEDGDRVNISSNEELMDSFIQTVKKQPFRPFRITVTAPAPSSAKLLVHVSAPCQGFAKKDDVATAAYSSSSKMQVHVSTPCQVFAKKGDMVTAANYSSSKMQVHVSTPCQGFAKKDNMPPIAGWVHNRRVGRCGGARDLLAEKSPTHPLFIHARHTCDGCSKTPIIGTRYHATKKADYDLCGACHKVYKGEDLGFVPEALDRDARMQGMWLKKQLKKSSLKKKQLVNLLEESRKVELKAEPSPLEKKEEGDNLEPSVESVTGDLSLEETTVEAVAIDGVESASKADNTISKQEKKPVDDKVDSDEANDTDTVEPIAPAPAPFFIHARHTCDGCSKTPIIGTRYTATKIPDFDLCEACFKSYEGEDLDFRPETLDIDACMQSKWLMKQLAKSAQASKGIVNLMKVLEGSAKAAAQGMATAKEGTVHTESNDSEVKGKDDTSLNEKSANGNAAASPHDCQKSKGNDDSFLSDAEGHGSIAEVIGRTLDVCVQAMEEAMADEVELIKNIDKKDVAAIASAAADSYSVASSMISSVTDILKKMDDSKGTIASDMQIDVPSTVSGATILKSVDDTHAGILSDEAHVEDASVESDSWSVIDDGKNDDEDEFAGAAEMIGSSLYNSGVMSSAEKGEPNDVFEESEISPIVVAKWDTELIQLNELGFTDERKNVDVLERLEAAHVGCDSTDEVTVNAAVEALLGDK